MGQGTTGPSLVSQLNIDTVINSYLIGSRDKTYYGSVHQQPLLFMDDIMRITDGVKEAQAGHIKLDYALEREAAQLPEGQEHLHGLWQQEVQVEGGAADGEEPPDPRGHCHEEEVTTKVPRTHLG